jgi:hypothetical protein
VSINVPSTIGIVRPSPKGVNYDHRNRAPRFMMHPPGNAAFRL